MNIIKITGRKQAIVILLEMIDESLLDTFDFGPSEPSPDSVFLYSIYPVIKSQLEVRGINYEIERKAFESALKYLKSREMIEISYAASDKPYGRILPEAMLETKNIIEYFKSRGISLDTITSSPANLPEKDSNKLEFDKKNSTLFFQGKEILISKAKNSRPHYVLTIVFSSRRKTWTYDEIAEKLSNDPNEYQGYKWQQYYHACRDINVKIAGETAIQDFLIFTKFEVSINTRYLVK